MKKKLQRILIFLSENYHKIPLWWHEHWQNKASLKTKKCLASLSKEVAVPTQQIKTHKPSRLNCERFSLEQVKTPAHFRQMCRLEAGKKPMGRQAYLWKMFQLNLTTLWDTPFLLMRMRSWRNSEHFWDKLKHCSPFFYTTVLSVCR